MFYTTLFHYLTGNQDNKYTINHLYDDILTWMHLMQYWPFVQGIQWWPEQAVEQIIEFLINFWHRDIHMMPL